MTLNELRLALATYSSIDDELKSRKLVAYVANDGEEFDRKAPLVVVEAGARIVEIERKALVADFERIGAKVTEVWKTEPVRYLVTEVALPGFAIELQTVDQNGR